ncbi:MAG: hypothetical protein ACFE0S_05350 [Rhodospirillales bacterium]
MTSKSDFDPEQWKKIASAPIIAAAVISASDDTGDDMESEEEEIQAFKDSLVKLRKKYGKTQLVADVLDAIEDEGTDEFDVLFASIGASASHESPLEDRIRVVGEAGEILESMADKKDAKQYKKFLIDAATAVASASKEGFFAFGSSISKKEEFYLRQIQSALDM